MADNIQIVRDTRLWVSTQTGDSPVYAPANTWEIEIQNDFSFSQDNNSSDITVEEAGAVPTRGSKRFNDSLNPADWSFATYLQPHYSTPDLAIITPDRVMWNSLATALAYDLTTPEGASANDVNFLVKFVNNQSHVLAKFDLIFNVDNVWYKITDCQAGSAAVSVDISDLGMVTWTGQGTTLTPLASAPFDPETETTVYTAETLAAPYIENRLTTMIVTDNVSGDSYDIPITAADIEINNNITYVTPNTLARLDSPVSSFTGTFEVSGSLEAFLRTNATGDGGTAELLEDMLADSAVQNSFTVAIVMGGNYATPEPGVVLVLKTAHLNLPTISTGDLLTTTIEFKGIPSSLSAGDEVFIGMSPTYTDTQINLLITTGDGKPV
jgi:hypothetical protein